MKQIVETCENCNSRDVVIERDAGWITGSWRMLRCKACGQKVFHHIPGWTLALYAIALAAAVWGWVVVAR